MSLKLLVAEDNQAVADVVAYGARMVWPDCEVTIAGSGEVALARFAAEAPDLVVLDVGMPPPDGFAVCARIRETSSVPILMLTVHDTTIDKVRAFDLGADDYLTKPFDHLELLARLRALVRRAGGTLEPATRRFVNGDLRIDFDLQEVQVRDDAVPLTTTEYRLLEALAQQAGAIVPHDRLLELVWGPDWVADTSYLKVFVSRLRRKLGDDADHPRYIQTAWGTGYRLIPQPGATEATE